MKKVAIYGLMAVLLASAAPILSGCSSSPEDKKLRGQLIVGAGAVLGTIVGGKLAD